MRVNEDFKLDELEHVYGYLFNKLGVNPAEQQTIVTEPQMLTDKDRRRMAEIMFETVGVPSLYMKQQALLSMYSYGATTGVIGASLPEQKKKKKKKKKERKKEKRRRKRKEKKGTQESK